MTGGTADFTDCTGTRSCESRIEYTLNSRRSISIAPLHMNQATNRRCKIFRAKLCISLRASISLRTPQQLNSKLWKRSCHFSLPLYTLMDSEYLLAWYPYRRSLCAQPLFLCCDRWKRLATFSSCVKFGTFSITLFHRWSFLMIFSNQAT